MSLQPLVIAIDLGGTQLRAALLNREGDLLKRHSLLTDAVSGPDAIVKQIGDLVLALLDGIPRDQVIGIGLSCPGPLDSQNGRTFAIATLAGFDGFPIAARLSEKVGLPVILEHDGHSATYGEWRHGAGKAYDDFIYITLSTGIGGGVISNGKLLRGHHGIAAHVGHMTIDPKGPVCGCGNIGCWEAIASGTSLIARARRELSDPLMDGRTLFDAARQGNKVALRLGAEEAEWIAIGLINLIHIFNPARIVIGGGLSAGLDVMQASIEARIARHAMPAFRRLTLTKAALGDNAGLIGVAMLALDSFDSKATATR